MRKIVVFASGSGSNAENIVEFFKNRSGVEVACILCNRRNAGVLDRAKRLNVKSIVFDRAMFYESDEVLNYLFEVKPDLIVLAGFLWLVPQKLVQNFPNRIVNIHPALLPRYGGKGMFGHHVHEAVLASGDRESGITIHYVNEKYDAGDIIFQARCSIDQDDTPESLAQKVHVLEHAHFPEVIQQVLQRLESR